MEEKRYVGKIYLDKDNIPHTEFDSTNLVSWKNGFITKSDDKRYYSLICPHCNTFMATSITTDKSVQDLIDWTIRRGFNYCYKCGRENVTKVQWGYGDFGKIVPSKAKSKLDF